MWPLRFSKIYTRRSHGIALITVSTLAPPFIPFQTVSQITERVFPNQILTVIFEYLDDYHLRVVSLISRCFNELALRISFSRFHGADLSSQVFDIPSWQLLHLRLALFIPRIQTLVCRFDPCVLLDLRDLRRLVSRLSYVHRLELHFPRDLLGALPFSIDDSPEAVTSPYIPDPTVAEEMKLVKEILYGVAGPDRPVFVITPYGRTFTCSPASILSWELEKCQYCESARQYTETEYDSDLTSMLHFFVCCSCCPLFLKKICERRPTHMPSRAIALLRNGSYAEVDTICSLRSLSIYHTQSSSHPFTVMSVNFASDGLWSLQLGDTNHLSAEEWSALLPDLDLSHINGLDISNDNISMTDVYLLLRRNPNISRVGLSHLSSVRISRSSFPSSPLFLTRISGHPRHIIDIFESGFTFPSICEIILRLCYSNDCCNLTDEAFRAITRHHMDYEIALTFEHGLCRPACRQLEFKDGGDKIEQHLHCVTNVVWYWLSEKNHALLSRWLALFPSLRELSLSWCFLKSPLTKDFLRRVRQCCPNVQGVSMNYDEPRTIDSWLEDPDS